MKKILLGFLCAIVISITTFYQNGDAITFQFFKDSSLGIIILTPLLAMLFYAIQHAGIPLLKDFMNGGMFDRVLILLIMLFLIYTKFFM